jgi:nucleotide-binding universal stress UspA family protein
MFHPRVILCPTDFSDNSTAALGIARDLARQNGATLIALHVADTLGAEGLGFIDAETHLQPEGRVEELRQALLEIAPPEPDLQLRHLLREGDPVAVVEQVVREQGCDLVVLGTHGRTGLEHLLMGSIAERVIRRCPCPVLVVKYPRTA